MTKTHLENGFLFMYDWLPLFKTLSSEGLEEVFWALIARQREGAAMPQFKDPMSAVCFSVIEPTIERRLKGQKGGQQTQKNLAEISGTPASKAKQAKQSIASIEERSKAKRSEEERAGACEAEQTENAPLPPGSALEEKEKNSLGEDQAVPKDLMTDFYEFTEEDRKWLISKGVPADYIDEREKRAIDHAVQQGKPVHEVLFHWWVADRAHPPWIVRYYDAINHPKKDESKFDCNSFDIDDFFQAALKHSFRECEANSESTP